MNDTSRDSNIHLLERIDSNITDAMLRGAQAYNKIFSVWWSPEIHYAYLETKYWKLRKIQAATHVSMENEIKQILDNLPSTSKIHDQHKTLFCWNKARKAKNFYINHDSNLKHSDNNF